MRRWYRGFFQIFFELFFDLGPLILVGALKEAEQLDARPQHFGLHDAVHELLQDLCSLVQILLLEAALGLVSHRRDLFIVTYKDGGELSDEDVPEPVEVAEPPLNLILERHSMHFVDCVLLREEAFVDDLGSSQPVLLADLDLESILSIELVQFGLFAGHRVVGEVLG